MFRDQAVPGLQSNDTVQYPRKLEYSATALRGSQISDTPCCKTRTHKFTHILWHTLTSWDIKFAWCWKFTLSFFLVITVSSTTGLTNFWKTFSVYFLGTGEPIFYVCRLWRKGEKWKPGTWEIILRDMKNIKTRDTKKCL
jgi:hypothetical protein